MCARWHRGYAYGGYSILAIPTLSRTIGGGVGMAGCHTLLNKKRSPKSFDSEDLK